MRFLKSKHTLTVVFLSLITSLSAQDEMDFYWATFSSGYGLNQTGQVVELYSCELPSREFIPYAKISLSDKYPSPNLWAHYGEFIYGFSNSNDFTRVQRINWHTKESLGARILHPKVSELFDEKLYVLEKSSADGVVLISSLRRIAVILDLENNWSLVISHILHMLSTSLLNTSLFILFYFRLMIFLFIVAKLSTHAITRDVDSWI